MQTFNMDSDEHQKLYGDPEKIVHYMDYKENRVEDNSRYIPDLVPGILQPLEVLDNNPITDKVLSELDIEKIVSEAEACTKRIEDKQQKDMTHFAEPISSDVLQDYSKHKYTPSTKKKALWASRIFEQWKCIRNYKLKQQGTNLENIITKNLLTMEIAELSQVLSLFLMEISL